MSVSHIISFVNTIMEAVFIFVTERSIFKHGHDTTERNQNESCDVEPHRSILFFNVNEIALNAVVE